MNQQILEEKIVDWLVADYREKGPVSMVIKSLRGMGPLVLIGGRLRDILLEKTWRFESDLDFVINPPNQEEFEKFADRLGAKPNRYGGYSLLSKEKWQVDVWLLKKTWAYREGHIEVEGFDDLLNSTFFNCDAIIYDFDNMKMRFAERYFEDLEYRVLGINLPHNPNRIGNAVRAIRYSLMKGFCWRLDIGRFVAETVNKHGWDCLVEKERESFNKTSKQLRLTTLNSQNFIDGLNYYISEKRNDLFDPREFISMKQLDLKF